MDWPNGERGVVVQHRAKRRVQILSAIELALIVSVIIMVSRSAAATL